MGFSGISTDELHQRAIAARQVKGGAEVTLMFLLAELEVREVYRDFGCSSIAHYAEFHLRLDARKARELARMGRVMDGLPQLREAFVRGEIAYSQLREISRVAGAEDEQEWVELARSRTSNQIQRIVARVQRGQRLESACEAGAADDDDEMTFRFTLTKDEGQRLREVLRQGRSVMPGCDEAAIMYAFVMKAATELRDEVLPAANTIVLYHDPESHVTLAPSADGFEEVSAAEFERCLCDSAVVDMRPSSQEPERPLGVAPAHPPELPRTIPRATRRAVMIRDAFRCTVPGCRHTLYVEIHHLDEFWRSGNHDLDNLTLLCTTHHKMWHDKLIQATGKPSTGLHWTDARGRTIGVTPLRSLTAEHEASQQPRWWGGRVVEVAGAA